VVTLASAVKSTMIAVGFNKAGVKLSKLATLLKPAPVVILTSTELELVVPLIPESEMVALPLVVQLPLTVRFDPSFKRRMQVGMGVADGVFVGVLVGLFVGELVGEFVAVAEGVPDGVPEGVRVAVLEGVPVGEFVAVFIGVLVGPAGTGVGVALAEVGELPHP
jgi:hypothetical protein